MNQPTSFYNNTKWLLLFFVFCQIVFSPITVFAANSQDVSDAKALELINNNPKMIIIDVRSPEEFTAGHISNAININIADANFEDKISLLAKESDPAVPWLVYCRTGNRSSKALPVISKHFQGEILHLYKGVSATKIPLTK